MKIKFLLLSLILLGSITFSAQDWDPSIYTMGEQYPGYVIDADGNKIEGFIKMQNRYAMQNEVLFFAEKGNKKTKTKYKTGDLKEYMIADKLYHCIHYSGGLMKKPIKANLVVNEGCITEYVWYDRAENFALMQQGTNESYEDFMARMYPSKMVFLKQGDEEPKSIDYFGIKYAKKMSEYIADNKDLSSKVANKEKGYGMLKILDVIAQYNANCE